MSHTDPERFATRFGYHAGEEDLDFGLEFLLSDERWKVLGERGHRYVSQIFAVEKAMEAHLEAYECVLREVV